MESDADQVRRAYEAYSRGDVDELIAMLDPQVELHEEPDLPDPGVKRGRDAVAAYFSDAEERWRDLSTEVTDVEQLDESTFLVRGILRGTGALSGAATKASFAHIVEIRDEKAVRLRFFFDEGQAIAAARDRLAR